jgi:hypothetical protein
MPHYGHNVEVPAKFHVDDIVRTYFSERIGVVIAVSGEELEGGEALPEESVRVNWFPTNEDAIVHESLVRLSCISNIKVILH